MPQCKHDHYQLGENNSADDALFSFVIYVCIVTELQQLVSLSQLGFPSSTTSDC
jgi:hypothetical protein